MELEESTGRRAFLAFLELYLLLCKVALDQGAHHLLGGLGGADVGNDEAAVGFLCVADPAWKEQHPKLQLKNEKQTSLCPFSPNPQFSAISSLSSAQKAKQVSSQSDFKVSHHCFSTQICAVRRIILQVRTSMCSCWILDCSWSCRGTWAGRGQHGQGLFVLCLSVEAPHKLLLALQEAEGPGEGCVKHVVHTWAGQQLG